MNNRAALMVLSSIMSFRMLGLFMILPVFSVYAEQFTGATPTLIGVTLGIYGLTQACLQIPFGMLSDRIGRKPVIFAGLLLFLLGSVLAALSHSIYLLMLARALQGAGAIGSTVLALVADLTPESQRGKAMAFVGMMIGLSFTIAMILGPSLAHWFSLSGIFWFTAILAVVAMLLTLLLSNPPGSLRSPTPFFKGGDSVFKNPQLLRCDFSIFTLHAILTSLFIVIPLILTKQLVLTSSEQIYFYLIILIVSFAIAVPFIVVAEKRKKIKPVFLGAITVIFLVLCLFYFVVKNVPTICVFLLLFFTAFTVLEALLPSLVSKIVPPKKKGAAMGVYSSSQFLGIFFGGAVGGAAFAHAGIAGVFGMGAVLSGIWLCVIFKTALHPLTDPRLPITDY